MNLKPAIILILTLTLAACDNIAVHFSPKKQPQVSHSRTAIKAEKQFWETLHKGRYNDIKATTRLLTAAYIDNPNDPDLAAHLGFLHIWKITERYRNAEIEPTIVNQIILSTHYFSDAVELDPEDARYLGFLGASQIAQGSIFHDNREQTRGYYTLKRAINQWPEFNYFTAGYVMSTQPYQSDNFKEGLAWQWATLDLCAGTKIDRQNPSFSPYMQRETQKGPQRACWNSWIAPYNFEGFFMNMGDMLVKSGDWQTAIKIYRNAQLAKNYSSWPYRAMLENKMAHAKDNVTSYRQEFAGRDKTILFNSGYGCVACHQQSRN